METQIQHSSTELEEPLTSVQVAQIPTESTSEFAVFADQLADEHGVTAMVSLGRVTTTGLNDPTPMSLDQCRDLIAALQTALDTTSKES